jgi:hypothetical protein
MAESLIEGPLFVDCPLEFTDELHMAGSQVSVTVTPSQAL